MYTLPGWYVALLAVSLLLSVALAWSLRGNRGRSTEDWLFWFLCGLCVWILGQIAILVARAAGKSRLSIAEQFGLGPLVLLGPYIGSAVTLVALLAFALEYTGNERFVTRRRVLAALIVPGIVIVGAVTNDYHSLFWVTLERVDDLDGWEWTGGVLLALNNLYSYGLSAATVVVLSGWAIRARFDYPEQALAVVAGIVPPLAVNVAWFVGLVRIDLTEVAFSLTAVLLWAAVAQYGLGDILPIARATVIENIVIGVVVVNERDWVVDANRAAKQLLGLDDQALVGSTFQAVLEQFENGDELENNVQASRRLTVTGTTPERVLSVDITPLYDQRGDQVGRVMLCQDISEQLERERELKRQNERLDTFAETVSHDLRNPLNVAYGRIQQVRDSNDNEQLQSASEALTRMEELIESTLTLARSGQPVEETERVELTHVAQQAWAMAETVDATLEVVDEFEFRAHRRRLQQLFENLFRNATDHAGRDVTVRVGTHENGFYVEDDGPGVPEDERDSVFETGYTTERDGTGFGLAIVEDIVEAHGWSVALTDSDDGGARFEITGIDSAPQTEITES